MIRYTFGHLFLQFPTHEVLAASPACFKALVGLRDKSYPVRASTLLRHRVFKNGLLRNLGTQSVSLPRDSCFKLRWAAKSSPNGSACFAGNAR